MAFSQKFKREVVREYNKGEITLEALAEKHEGVSVAMISAWKGRGKRNKKPASTLATKITPKKTDKPFFVLTGQTVSDLRSQLDRLEALRG